MIDVEETNGGLRVVDAAKNEVEVELMDWTSGGEMLSINRDTEVTIVGAAKEVRIPGSGAIIESSCKNRLQWLSIDDKMVLSEDNHLIQADNIVTVFVRSDSEFTLSSVSTTGQIILSFPNQTQITLGFRSHICQPSREIKLSPTVEGLAFALSSLAGSHKSDTADRSYPSMRGHPPLLEVDDSSSANVGPCDQPNSSTILRVPRSFQYLFVVAPLAYYLGAIVKIEGRETPLLETTKREYCFSASNSFAEEVGEILSRMFYLDCLVRNAGPFGFDIRGFKLLDEISLDARHLYALSPDERLDAYFEVPFKRISNRLPDWPLAVSIKPSLDNIRAIPHLLNRMALIFPPESKSVDERAIVKRSLGDFHRSTTSRCHTRRSGISGLIEPVNRRGVDQGWIADGTPVDAFKCIPDAFSNRLDYLGRTGPLSFAVILNADEMRSEFSKVAKTYQSCADAYSIEVDVMDELSTTELSAIFVRPYDFVHYIGHCDPEGLRCWDGNLTTGDLRESNVQSFFLNACHSYEEGLGLIRRGSVAGAVTMGNVLDDQASKVGTTFARLIGGGYSVQRSLVLSRAQTIINRQYTTVGDGTHTLTQGQSTPPTILFATEKNSNEFIIQTDSTSPRFHGGLFQSYSDEKPVIAGTNNSHTISTEEFQRCLHLLDGPIVYNDRVYLPEELLKELF